MSKKQLIDNNGFVRISDLPKLGFSTNEIQQIKELLSPSIEGKKTKLKNSNK